MGYSVASTPRIKLCKRESENKLLTAKNGCQTPCQLLHFWFFSAPVHARLTTFIIYYPLNEAKADQLWDTSFYFFFSNSVPRILKCRVLIGKLVHNVRAHLHCCPITANEVLVQQIWIALGAFRPIPASCSTWKHLHVVLSLAITPLANSFLSQHFYCICCTRQTAIKPR